MLTKKRSVAELHFLNGFYVFVGEGKIPFVPGTVGIFKAGSKVGNFETFDGFLENFFDEVIYLFVFEEEGDRDGEI